MTELLSTARTPIGPAFTVVLICHVASVLLSLVAAVAGIVAGAVALTARGELAPWVRSYFSPGVNWGGRVLSLVPVFGAMLLAMSGGAYHLGDAWVEAGIGLWAAATILAEGVVWPAERRVQRARARPVDGGRGVGEELLQLVAGLGRAGEEAEQDLLEVRQPLRRHRRPPPGPPGPPGPVGPVAPTGPSGRSCETARRP
jgi:hypothetical protein